jgi:hypothetical protein
MATVATIPANPLSGLEKYFNLAAASAIAVQQVAKDAPNETKLGLALNFVNVGLSAVASAIPAAAPLLGLAAGLESPFAGMISSIVQLFKHHNLHGFAPSKGTAPVAVAQPIAIAQPAATAPTPAVVQTAAAADWAAGAQVGG